jgi:DNA-binding NarL/FixJ family response regulator
MTRGTRRGVTLMTVAVVAPERAEELCSLVLLALPSSSARSTSVEALTDDTDLVVLDLSASAAEWIEAVRRARQMVPEASLVCLFDRAPATAHALLREGADAVLERESFATGLGIALRAATLGYTMLPRSHEGQLRPLSARERQILGMVTMSLSNSEIAAKLHITEHTVKSHLSSAFAKLQVRTRTEATARILGDREIAAGILGLSETRDRLSLPNVARST